MRFNSRAWMVWVLVVAFLAMFARNPLYSIILLALSLLAIQYYARIESPVRSMFLQISLGILLFSAIYHALFIHIGDHVLFELPQWPLIGGIITVEAIADGFRNGLVLIALIATFMALNTIVPSRELVRLVPAAFQDLAVVVLIAITYVPETRRHLRRIREAQAIRGHRPRGFRDWRPLILPLLVGGLERAMRLSEAMVARGHVSERAENSRAPERILLIAGLFTALIGWVMAILWGVSGYILLSLGGLVLVLIVVRKGRRVRRTSFVAVPWTATDTILVFTSLAALILVIAPWPVIGRLSLSYVPYPLLKMPEFHPLVGLALILLSFPILMGMTTQRDHDRMTEPDQNATSSREGIRQAR